MQDKVKAFMIENIKKPTSWAIRHALNPKIITNRMVGKGICAKNAIKLQDIFANEYNRTDFTIAEICIPGYQSMTGKE